MSEFDGQDPIKVGKDKLGVVQELRDRTAWPKVTALDVEPEVEPEVEKPKRGRPAKRVEPEVEPVVVAEHEGEAGPE